MKPKEVQRKMADTASQDTWLGDYFLASWQKEGAKGSRSSRGGETFKKKCRCESSRLLGACFLSAIMQALSVLKESTCWKSLSGSSPPSAS